MKINQQRTPVQVSEWSREQQVLPRYSMKARAQMVMALVLALPKRGLNFLKTRKTSRYLYAKGVHKHPASWAGVIAVVFLAGFWLVSIYQPTLADTDTQTIRPNAVIGGAENNFAVTGGTANSSCSGHCDYVDEGDDNTYLSTGTGMDGTTAEEEFDMADISVPGNATLDQITQVVVTARSAIVGGCQGSGGTPCDGLQARLYIDGAYNGTTNSVTLSGTTTNHTFTWSSLSEPTASDIRVEIVRVANGGGSSSAKDDDVRIFEVKADVTFDYTPDPIKAHFTLEGYAFENDIRKKDSNFAGYQFPSTTGQTSSGNNTWTGVANITDSDDTRATASLSTDGFSIEDDTEDIEATNFGFNIPNDATITLIEVRTEICSSGSGGTPSLSAQLIHSGTQSGDLDSANFPTSCASDQSFVLDGTNELWNLTVDPSDINASNFGVAVYATIFNASSSWTVEIDSVEVRVTYQIGSDPSVSAGSEFSSGKTLTQVRKGELIGLRTHITNDGGALSPDTQVGLFYDRNDGIWNKVQQHPSVTDSNSGCDDSNFNCESLLTSNADNGYTSIAISPSGQPWMAFYDTNPNDLKVARYVGSGGNGCANTTSWSCETVDATSNVGENPSLTFDTSGNAWVAYEKGTSNELKVARFVGSGGNCDDTGGSDAWQCTVVETVTGGAHEMSIAVASDGTAWVSYKDIGNLDLRVAQFTGTGTENTCSTGSSNWDCVTVDATNEPGSYTSIALDATDSPWVAHYDSSTDNLLISYYIGSGGNCDDNGGSDAWQCDVVEATNSVGSHTSIAFAPDGTARISYTDSTNNDLRTAYYVESGGSCESTGGSAAWECELVDATGTVGEFTGLAFDPAGSPWIIYADATNNKAKLARYVGSGGNCDNTGGSDAWQCSNLDSVTPTSSNSSRWQIAFDAAGNAWTSYYDGATFDVYVAQLNIDREITISSSEASSSRDSLTDSHSDMTSSSDTSNRDDADCLSAGASWNDGLFTEADNLTGLSLPDGQTTAQCSELGWTVDTSNAVPGTTYRFIVATDDSYSPEKSTWRGPVAVAADGYPTLTVATSEFNTYYYSKDVLGSYSSSDCTNSNWACDVVYHGTSATDALNHENSRLAVDRAGNVWTTIQEYNGSAYDLVVAKYVGSGGNCDGYDGANGSDAWQCEKIATGNSKELGEELSKIYFDNNNTPYILFREESSSIGSLSIAKYVGSGGNCDTYDGSGGSDAWECEMIVEGDQLQDAFEASLSFLPSGDPVGVVRQRETPVSNIDHLVLFRYVGIGGNCDGYDGAGGSDAWQCEMIIEGDEAFDAGNPMLMVDPITGQPHVISTFWDTSASSSSDIVHAYYVGSGGSCDGFEGAGGSDAWQCEVIYDGGSSVYSVTASDAVMDANGTIWVTARDQQSGSGEDLVVLKYVESGGNCDGFDGTGGSDAWQCVRVFDGEDVSNDTDLPNIAINNKGNPVVAFIDKESTTYTILTAEYVGSGNGNCQGLDGTGGSNDWQCTSIQQDSNTKNSNNPKIAFSNGRAIVMYVTFENGSTEKYLNIAVEKATNTVPTIFNNMNYNGVNDSFTSYNLSAGLAPYTNSYGACASPAGANNGYCGTYNPDGQSDSVTAQAYERPLYNFSTRFSSSSTLPSATLHFKTGVSPSTNNVVLQVYRYGSTNAWETVSTYTSAGCSSENCIIRAHPSGTASEYFETDGSNYWVHYRVYQVESSSSSITFEIDSFTAEVPQKQMRGGRVFRELQTDPLGW